MHFSRDDLARMVAAYDPKRHPAPIVVGHPEIDAPAFGWVHKFALREDGKVVAEAFEQVDPEFVGLVRDGRYKRVSLALFKPDAPGNPVPGTWYPRHLGFLGAAAPALPHLRPVTFAGEVGAYLVFGAYEGMTVAHLFRSIKNFLLAKFGTTDEALIQETLPEPALLRLHTAASVELDASRASGAYAAPDGSGVDETKEGDSMAEELEAARQAAQEAERRAAEADAARLRAEQQARSVQFAATAQRLVSEGRLHPDEVEGYVAFFASGQESVAFAASDGKSTQVNLREWFDRLLARRAPLVQTRPSGDTAATSKALAALAFSAPDRVPVDAERLELHQRAQRFAEANKVDYLTAVRAVSQQGVLHG